MTVPFLTPEHETYCQHRVAGRGPLQAAHDAFASEPLDEKLRLSAVAEASPMIQDRYRELGRPDLVKN